MEIKNKMESIRKINELNLNRFPEQVFNKGEEEKSSRIFKNVSSTLLCH